MGSYINIGLAASNTIMKESVRELFRNLKGFEFLQVLFPNNNYDDWISIDNKECSVEEAIDYCLKYKMSYFIGSFIFGYKRINNVEFTFEKAGGDIVCLIIKIPDEELLNDIDKTERCVIDFLKLINGFIYAFCDSEAHLDDERYSIYVQYLNEPIILYEDWKIDGLTRR